MLELPPLLVGTFCPACNYPSGSQFVISRNTVELPTILPSGWETDIFYRTIFYINQNTDIIFYPGLTELLSVSTPKPLIFLLNTDSYNITDFNTLLNNLFNIDTFLFANINNLFYANLSLYVPSNTILRKFACVVYGNMYVHAIAHNIWNVGDYIVTLVKMHNNQLYFCPANDKVRGHIVGGYSNAVLNTLRDNNVNVPYRNVILGPINLYGDVFAIVYAHVVIKRLVRAFLRRYIARENNEYLWSEVEADLKNMLTEVESVPCGPVIINVLVNDPNMNTPNSNVLNVEIQYSNAGTFSSFASGPHAYPGGLAIPPIGGYFGTINVQVRML